MHMLIVITTVIVKNHFRTFQIYIMYTIMTANCQDNFVHRK